MKKITLLFLLIGGFVFSQSTINITTSGGSWQTEKWVSITTGPDGTGTLVWGQGDGTYGNGSGLINQDIQIDSGTYYVNCYDQYADGWDGTLITVSAYGTVIGDNGGSSPDDGLDNDAGWAFEDPSVELEASFAIVVPEPPSCPPPTALSAASITNSSAEISWTSDESLFNVEVVDITGGGTATGTATYTGVTLPYSLSGLSSNNEYEVYVQTDCGSGETSDWANLSFTTSPGCGGIITDSGGAAGDYGTNESVTLTVFPDNVGDVVTFTFLNFDVEGSPYDYIIVYDGPDTNSDVVGTFSTTPAPITSTHASGALTFYFTSDGTVVAAGYEIQVSCAPPPACLAPTDVTADQQNATTTTVDVSWLAGGSETDYEYVNQLYGTGEPTVAGTPISANSVQLTGLTPGTIYEFYVRSVCGSDNSAWSAPAYYNTECAVATTAFTNDFTDVTDTTCWLISDGVNGTSSWTYSQADGFWFLPFESDFTTQHDDMLISPAFTVTDNLTDGFQYYIDRPDSTWVNRYDILVYDANDLTSTGLLGTLATDFIADPLGATYTHDLSAFEGMDVRIAFHDYSIADNQDTYKIDNFVVDSYAALGVEEASMAQFTYFPNPVNDVLTIKAQKAVEDITVFNMLGQVVKRQTPNDMNCTVDLSAMQSGAYFVQVSIDNTVETVRVLKK